MSTPARIADRHALALAVVTGMDRMAALGFGPVTAAVDEIEIQLHYDTDDGAALVAALDLVHLSFEVAAIVVEHAALPEDPTAEPADQVRLLAARDLVRLRLVGVESGSIRLRFSVDPRTRNGRKRLLALAAIGTALASIIAPPLTIAATVAGVAVALNDVVTPDQLQSLDHERALDVSGSIAMVTTSTQIATEPADDLDGLVRGIVRDEVAKVVEQALVRDPSEGAPPATTPDGEGGETPPP